MLGVQDISFGVFKKKTSKNTKLQIVRALNVLYDKKNMYNFVLYFLFDVYL